MNILNSSDLRSRFFAQYFAVFASIYHVAFIILFKVYDVTPMVYMNLYSVPFFISLIFISSKAKSYIFIYLWSCCEVYTHQLLGLYCLGGISSFHFFFIPFALLPLYTFKKHFNFAMLLAVAGGIVFFIFEIKSHNLPPMYTIPGNVLSVIQMINVSLALIVILSSVFLYVLIAWLDEKNLEKEVFTKTDELRQKDKKVLFLQSHTVNSLANLVENRDSETGEHIQRTSKYVHLIADTAFKNGIYKDTISENYIDRLTRAAPMHDIGKIVITDVILKKPTTLTEDEYERIKIHTTEGAKIVKDIVGVSDDKEYLKIAEEVALYHHEKWDGTGYPEKLKGTDIPLSARIMAIADVFDALVSERCYKPAVDTEDAFTIIREESGRHFDPTLVELFLKIKEEIKQIAASSKDLA